MQEIKLRNCPFCGNEPMMETYTTEDGIFFQICCSSKRQDCLINPSCHVGADCDTDNFNKFTDKKIEQIKNCISQVVSAWNGEKYANTN